MVDTARQLCQVTLILSGISFSDGTATAQGLEGGCSPQHNPDTYLNTGKEKSVPVSKVKRTLEKRNVDEEGFLYQHEAGV